MRRTRRRCCCSKTTRICALVCGTIPLAGATIQVTTSTGVFVTQCGPTDSSGCCSVTGISTGTYSIKVVFQGTTYFTGLHTITAGGSTAVTVNASRVVCCGPYAIPYDLTLTDAAGSLSFQYCSACSTTYPTWTGGQYVQRTSCPPQFSNGNCFIQPPSTGPVKVCYQMQCISTQTPKFTLARNWAWVYYGTPLPGTPTLYQDPSPTTAIVPGSACIAGNTVACGGAGDTSLGSANPSSTSPFAIAFAMVDQANQTTDPIGSGDTVSVSQ